MYKSPFFFFLIILLLSCHNDDFLEKRPHYPAPENVYNQPEGALMALNGIYDILQTQEYVERFEMMGDVLSPDVVYTGEPGGNDSPYQKWMESFHPLTNLTGPLNYWKTMFTGIYRCNELLEVLSDTEHLINFSEPLRQRIMGEIFFLRGLIEFKLLIFFSGMPQLQQDFDGELLGLPFYDHVPAPKEYYPQRPSLEESWQRMEDDFQEAIPRLPLRSEYAPDDIGRATKGAAQAMLAKTYLFTERWQEAFDLAEIVVQSGEYWLVGDDEHPGPFTVHRTSKEGMVSIEMPAHKWIFQPEADNCGESVFSVQYSADHSDIFPQGQEGNLRPKCFGPRGVMVWNEEYQDYMIENLDWGLYQPTTYFVETAFRDIGGINDEGDILDPRFKFSVLVDGDSVPYYYEDENVRLNHPDSIIYNSWYQWPGTGFGMWKYFADPVFRIEATTLGDLPHDIHYLRYADVLLMAAEAALHIGQGGKALEYVNLVRLRARNCGNTGFPRDLENISLTDVYAERRVELAFEGHAFFDLVRTRRIAGVMDDAGQDYYDLVCHPEYEQCFNVQRCENFQSGLNEIIPIPSSEIELSEGSLTQNPGYE